ncbi:MAG TPA: hypothetical protein VIK55_20265 [Paludibacter sp.]
MKPKLKNQKSNLKYGVHLMLTLEQTERITGHKPKIGIVDRGYKRRKAINGYKIVIPAKLPASANNY